MFLALFSLSKQRLLTDSKRQNDLIANLPHADGWKSWKSLDAKNQWIKEHVWCVLCASSELPREMTEENWERGVPASIRNDRDLLLARMDRKEFAEYYNKRHINTSTARIFLLPSSFCGDKQVVTKVVKLWPKILLQNVLTQEILADKDVFGAFLDSDQVKSPRVSQKNRGCFLSKFCGTKIRGNATCMLEAAKTLGPVVLGNLSKPLRASPYVATKLIDSLDSVPPNAKELFSGFARYSKNVGLALVRKNGLCLRHLDKSLHNTQMVRTACQQNPAALAHCLSDSAKRTLGGDKAFMLDIFSRLWRSFGDPALYEMLSAVNKLDYELITAAYKKKSLAVCDIPASLVNDRQFWKTIIMFEGGSFWKVLPDKFKAEPEFAMRISCFEDSEMANEVLTQFPTLRSDRSVWVAILDSDDMYEIYDLLERFAPKEILDDKELMRAACDFDSRVMDLVDAEFLKDKDFVESALRDYLEEYESPVLPAFPFKAQLFHPHLVVEAIKHDFDDEPPSEDEATYVAEELWAENLEVAEAWFEVGGFFHSLFRKELKDNESFGLMVARVCESEMFSDFFGLIDVDDGLFLEATSADLRSKKSFMLQVVTVNRSLFFSIDNALLKADRDIVATLLSGSREESRKIIYDLLDRDDGNFELLRKVRAYAREKVAAVDSFKAFLPGVMASAEPDCYARLLVNDEETTLALKKHIGGFVGIPRDGKEAAVLRRSAANLEWLSLSALRRNHY